MANDSTTVKVGLSGKRGKVVVTVNDGSTIADVITEAASILGVTGFKPAAATADGQPVDLDEAVPAEAEVVNAVPAARLG